MWTPSEALATLATLVILMTLATSARKQDELLPYEVITHKGSVGSTLDESRGPFYIPDGQCTGVFDHELTCYGGWTPVAVRIIMQDGAPYPLVGLFNSLRGVSVVRAPPCAGSATIGIRLACTNDTAESP